MDKRTAVFVEIYKVEIDDHSEHPVLHRVIAKQIYPQSNRGEWIAVDFTETVSEWFKNSKSNYGFVVNATAHGKKIAITDMNIDKGKKVREKLYCIFFVSEDTVLTRFFFTMKIVDDFKLV